MSSRTVLGGGFLLALCAGWLNAIGYLDLAHQAMSHVTGTLSIAGIAISTGAFGNAAIALTVVGAFFLGALLSGAIVGDSHFSVTRRYGLALVVESTLLVGALALFLAGNATGEYLGAAACGLQNGLVTRFSGAVVRTTHMTGVVTDLGLAIGQALRRVPIDALRVRVHLFLLLGFLLGGVGGGVSFARLSHWAMLLPIAVTGAAGTTWTVVQHRRRLAA